MSDFDLLLDSILDERFVNESTSYYDDPITIKEIEDMELGLVGEFSEDDVKNHVSDKEAHASGSKVLRYPGRVGLNY